MYIQFHRIETALLVRKRSSVPTVVAALRQHSSHQMKPNTELSHRISRCQEKNNLNTKLLCKFCWSEVLRRKPLAGVPQRGDLSIRFPGNFRDCGFLEHDEVQRSIHSTNFSCWTSLKLPSVFCWTPTTSDDPIGRSRVSGHRRRYCGQNWVFFLFGKNAIVTERWSLDAPSTFHRKPQLEEGAFRKCLPALESNDYYWRAFSPKKWRTEKQLIGIFSSERKNGKVKWCAPSP